MRVSFTQCVGLTLLFASTITACKTINPGEVGFVIHKGVIRPRILTQGRYHYNIFSSTIRTFNTRITDYSITMRPPTKEGLEVKVDVTVLYHIKPEAAPSIYAN